MNGLSGLFLQAGLSGRALICATHSPVLTVPHRALIGGQETAKETNS